MRIPRGAAIGIGSYGLLAIAGGVFAYFALFSQFAPHDDTGHLSVSLTEFIAGRNLYEDLYSQYGPLYFLAFGGLFSLPAIELTTDSVRILTLVFWVVSGLLLGVGTERFTQDRRLGLVTGAIAYAVLVCLAREPMHPIGVTTLITCAIVAVALWNRSADSLRVALGLGLLVGAMAMIKINIGALCAVGAIAAALIVLAGERHRLIARAAAVLLLCGAAFTLLSTSLDDGWVAKLLVAQVAGSLAVVARSFALDPPATGTVPLGRWLGRFAAAGAAVVTAVSLLIFALGTTPAGLLDGVVVDPTHHPGIDVLALPLTRTIVVLICLSAIVAAALTFASGERLDRAAASDAGQVARAAARMIAALLVIYSIMTQWPVDLAPGSGQIALALAFAWIAAVAPRELREPTPVAFARMLVVLISVSAALGAYPVAGSQMGAAALPFCVVAALMLSDGLRLIAPVAVRLGLGAGAYAVVTTALITVLGLHVLIADVVRPARDARRAWKANVALDLRGAKLTRVPAQQADAYRQIVNAVRQNRCDAVQSNPGNYSLNGWYPQRPPTGYNVTSWALLVSEKDQRRMIAELKRVPRLCILRIRNVDFDFEAISVPPLDTKPGYRYIDRVPQHVVLVVDNGQRLRYTLSVRD